MKSEAKMSNILITLALLAFTNFSFALTGNELYQDMQTRPQFAHGYIYGVTEMMANMPNACIQKGVTYGQISDVAYNYIRDNPQARHNHAIVIIGSLIDNNFSCKK